MIPNTATGKVYFRITNNSPNTVAVLNTANVATALPVSLGPANIIRVNPTLNRIYVGGQVTGQPNQIHVLNGANDQEIATLTLGAPHDVHRQSELSRRGSDSGPSLRQPTSRGIR